MTPPDPQQVAEIAGHLSKVERRASPERRYYLRRSQPLGRPDMRAKRLIRPGQRMKPKAWNSAYWFKSALFERGNATRRWRFMKLLADFQGTAHVEQ